MLVAGDMIATESEVLASDQGAEDEEVDKMDLNQELRTARSLAVVEKRMSRCVFGHTIDPGSSAKNLANQRPCARSLSWRGCLRVMIACFL
jgi:hypothetical protein